ncbi:hypothetical protein [Halostagnicola bangensis]
MVGRRPRGRGNDADEYGVDSSRYTLSRYLSPFVPAALARRAVVVSVSTDRDVYERGDSVEVTAEFKNRLPVPVELATPSQRRWGWSVDGFLEASDERLYTRSSPSTFRFRGGERKRVSFVWNGRLEYTRGRHESVRPEPGEHEIRVFVATRGEHDPSDTTTITLE